MTRARCSPRLSRGVSRRPNVRPSNNKPISGSCGASRPQKLPVRKGGRPMQIVRAETEFNHGYPVPTGRPEQEFGDLDPPPPYQVGVQCRWLVADFCHLVEVWKELREMNR